MRENVLNLMVSWIPEYQNNACQNPKLRMVSQVGEE
jgi:hypothetical protein